MRLSEAIRLGATMKPQGFGGSLLRTSETAATCALQAAMDAIGKDSDYWFDAIDVWEVTKVQADCPCACDVRWNGKLVCDVVWHLNDQHNWSRERIADWVELQEGLPIPEQQPEVTAVDIPN